MFQQIVSQTGTGTSTPVSFDYMRNPFNVSIGCVVTGTVTYTIQHTFDDLNGTLTGVPIAPSAATWFPHDSSDLVNATTNQNDNYAFPCKWSRINVSAGTGTVTATYIQAGLSGG